MMKRILCFLLVLGTLLSVFPLAVPFAEEEKTLPMDVSDTFDGDAEEGRAPLTDYDTLYVGGDGGKTVNGGTLLGLYTAFAGDVSVDLTVGSWQNKMDPTGATDAVIKGTSFWVKKENGFGYAMNLEEWTADGEKVGIDLPAGFAALPSFTVEMLSATVGIRDESGSLMKSDRLTWKGEYSSFRFELLSAAFFAGYRLRSGEITTTESFCARWTLSNATLGQLDYNLDGETGIAVLWEKTASAYGGIEKPVILGSYFGKQNETDRITYSIEYDPAVVLSNKNLTNNFFTITREQHDTLSAVAYTDKVSPFSVYNGLPADVYTIRVYDKPLTSAERAHNRFIDMAAFYGIDLARYTALDAAGRAVVENFMSGIGFDVDRAAVQKSFEDVFALFDAESFDLGKTFYVTKGLTGFFSAYAKYSTAVVETGESFSWVNCMKQGEVATFLGEGWTQNPNGGLTIVKSYDEYCADRTFGLYLPSTLLPDGDYTVEFVSNPVGASQYDENGDLERYVDNHTKNGTYHEYGIGIGPLRAFQYGCYRPLGKDGRLERRWIYSATGGLESLNWKYRAQDMSWGSIAVNDVVTLSIMGDFSEQKRDYFIYKNTASVCGFSVGEEEFKSNEEAGNMFQLMVGVAGTMYAVRVYNRTLSHDEMAQNYMADLICYYDIDVSKYAGILRALKSKAGGYDAFLAIGFTLSKEEAEEAFFGAISDVLVDYNGIGVKKDEDGLRFYFDLGLPALNAMRADGYTIEVGAIVNVNKSTVPMLAREAFDYRIEAYTSDGGRNRGYFIDEDTFALTIIYKNTDKKALMTNVSVRGYLKLTDADGAETILYIGPSTGDFDVGCLFDAYTEMCTLKEVKNGAAYDRINSLVSSCYEYKNIYVQVGAAIGGDGSKKRPYASFLDGFAAAKAQMKTTANPLSVTLHLGDGIYSTGGEITLTGEDMPYRHTDFTISSDTGNAVLTTAKPLDAADFDEQTDNLWVYRFEKDENGEYPRFRYVYVDGKRTEVAAGSPTRGEDEGIYRTVYGRKVDGVYETVKAYHNQRILETAPCPYTRGDLVAEYNYYKELFLNNSDFAESVKQRTEDPLALGKMYLAEDMVGDFRDEVEKGIAFSAVKAEKIVREAQAAFDAEKAKYDAADAAGKLKLQKAYDAAAKTLEEAEARAERMTGEYTKYRYAHEHLALEVHITAQWCFNIIHVSGIDYEDTLTDIDGNVHVAVYLNPEEYKYFAINKAYDTRDRYVYLKNDISYVDEENEMFYDEETGTLYYYSEQAMAGRSVMLPTSDHLLVMDNVHDVTLYNLDFTGTDDLFLSDNGLTGQLANGDHRPGLHSGYPDRSAVLIRYGNGVVIDTCDFYELPVDAVHCRNRIDSMLVYDCTFTNLGGTALRLGDAILNGAVTWGKEYGNEGVKIEENYINNVAMEYRGAPALSMTFNKDCIVTRNTIMNCSYSAMMIGMGFKDFNSLSWRRGEDVVNDNTEISYNYITNFMTEMADGAAIYMTMYNSNREDGSYFNFVHHNYVKMSSVSGDGRGGMLVGIYFDGGTSNWKCYNNVVAEQSYGAVKGEADEEADSHYVSRLRKRYTASIFIYIQHIEDQECHHILCENNYILNVRANDPANQQKEVYRTYVVADRDIDEINTHYERNIQRISLDAEDIIYGAGCYRHMGDPAELYDNNY